MTLQELIRWAKLRELTDKEVNEVIARMKLLEDKYSKYKYK